MPLTVTSISSVSVSLEQRPFVLGRYHVPGAFLAAAPFFVTRLETPGSLQRIARTAWRTSAVEGIGHSGALSTKRTACQKVISGGPKVNAIIARASSSGALRRCSPSACAPLSWASTNSARRLQTNAHTDPQSLVDVWPRRNVVSRIPPRWLIFLGAPRRRDEEGFYGTAGSQAKDIQGHTREN
jgi:hypothetical protein